MSEFEHIDFEVEGNTYNFTLGDVFNTGDKSVVAVTDYEDEKHYVSNGIEAYNGDISITHTLPSNNGTDFEISEVSPRQMSKVSEGLNKGDIEHLEEAIRALEPQEEPTREAYSDGGTSRTVDMPSSQSAKRKKIMYDFQRSPSDFLE